MEFVDCRRDGPHFPKHSNLFEARVDRFIEVINLLQLNGQKKGGQYTMEA